LWGDYVSEKEALEVDGGYQPMKIVFNACQPQASVDNHCPQPNALPSNRFREPSRQDQFGAPKTDKDLNTAHQVCREVIQNYQNVFEATLKETPTLVKMQAGVTPAAKRSQRTRRPLVDCLSTPLGQDPQANGANPPRPQERQARQPHLPPAAGY
jgi:hypothetical protein